MSTKKKPPPLLFSPLHLFLLLLLLLHSPSSAVDLLFNGFDTTDLNLFGNSTLESGHRRHYLSLNPASNFTVGRALYKSPIPTKSTGGGDDILPFSASFIFSIAVIPGVIPGHGLAFLFAPAPGTLGATSAQYLGLFNRTAEGDPTDRVLAVEFDVFENPEFSDINANHVGVDRNSLFSVAAQPAGFWPDSSSSFVNLTLNDGSNYQAWIDYSDRRLNVTIAPASLGRKPLRPLISIDLHLSDLFLDEMYVGFCASTGILVEHHRILAWSFSNSNFSLSEGLITSGLPNFVPLQGRSSTRSRGLVAGVSVAIVVLLISLVSLFGVIWRRRKRKRIEEEEELEGAAMGDWELEYWPHRISYREILRATDGFSDRNLIGFGGNGRVYKGILGGGCEEDVAVKLFSRSTEAETKEFLSEVSTLGRLKHRNLVGLRGWYRKRELSRDLMLLVYDYMENGSLDKRIFTSSEPLDWGSRTRILRDVAAGLLYLHEEWESRVLHRDIKASNVLLDRDMNGRLGDFGLARVHPHGRALGTTRVVGSVGYMAPEVVRSGKASAQTDVYGYGVLVLEVVCGRRPMEEEHPLLIGWVRGLVEQGEAWTTVEPRVRGTEGYDEGEAERVIRVGLMCTCEDPARRPTMREVVRWMEGVHEMEACDGGESVEARLLDDGKLRVGLGMVWSAKRGGVGDGGSQQKHLTFEELRQSLSLSLPGSTSLSGSDVIVEGR